VSTGGQYSGEGGGSTVGGEGGGCGAGTVEGVASATLYCQTVHARHEVCV
jgi:hypothetical protein